MAMTKRFPYGAGSTVAAVALGIILGSVVIALSLISTRSGNLYKPFPKPTLTGQPGRIGYAYIYKHREVRRGDCPLAVVKIKGTITKDGRSTFVTYTGTMITTDMTVRYGSLPPSKRC